MRTNASKNTAQVHRFGNHVALYVGTGQTIYISPLQALELANAINNCACDCLSNERFTESKFSTFTITFKE